MGVGGWDSKYRTLRSFTEAVAWFPKKSKKEGRPALDRLGGVASSAEGEGVCMSEREGVCQREGVCVSERECVREREGVAKRKWCVCQRERGRVCQRERACVCQSKGVCVSKKEGECVP